jgi:hypothetical protein
MHTLLLAALLNAVGASVSEELDTPVAPLRFGVGAQAGVGFGALAGSLQVHIQYDWERVELRASATLGGILSWATTVDLGFELRGSYRVSEWYSLGLSALQGAASSTSPAFSLGGAGPGSASHTGWYFFVAPTFYPTIVSFGARRQFEITVAIAWPIPINQPSLLAWPLVALGYSYVF